MILGWITLAVLVCCAVVAALLARRRADHRPFAIFLVIITFSNLLRVGRTLIIPIHPVGADPYTGAARVAFHIDEALFLMPRAALAILLIVLFTRPRWTVALPCVAWAGTVAYLASHYPAIRGQVLRDVYLCAELAVDTLAAGTIITWTWRRVSPTPAHLCTLLFCLLGWVALMGGSLRWGLWDHWYLDQIVSLLLYVTLIGFQVSSWRSHSSSQ